MFDLHAHILPGLDDGPPEFETSIEMASVAAADGTTVMLCTPHRKDVTERSSVTQVRDLVAELDREVRVRGIGLELLVGMENHLDVDLPDEFENGRALTMNGGRYALVEMPFFGRPNYVEDVLFRLQVQGVTPVLAHPERIQAFQDDPDLLASFVERGMLSQITGGSVLGYFGRRVRRVTHSMLRRRLAHIIASDTHYPDGPRSPKLRRCEAAAAAVVGEERAHRMVVDTPRAVLGGEDIEIESPRADPSPQRWWQVWR